MPATDLQGPTVNMVHLAGSEGPWVLFLHANGFPVHCYRPIVSPVLSDAVHLRCLRYIRQRLLFCISGEDFGSTDISLRRC